MFAKKSKKTETTLQKKRIKSDKSKYLIKHKGCQKFEKIKEILKITCFVTLLNRL